MFFRKITGAVVAGALLILAVSATADAATVKIEKGSYQTGQGGEFKATTTGISGLPDGVSFQTYCLEKNRSLSFDKTYTAVVNTAAVSGGVSGGNPDPIDPLTAYLYNEFWNGTLSGYDFADSTLDGRLGSADALQKVIWYIEGELLTKPWVTGDGSLEDKFYDLAVSSGWTDIGSVRVLNLTDAAGNDIQDVLTVVPLPSAGLAGLLLLGALGVAGAIRRRTQRITG